MPFGWDDAIVALAGLAGGMLGSPKPKVDPVSATLANWMQQFGAQTLSQINQEASAQGLTPQTLAMQREANASGQTALQQGLPAIMSSMTNAGFDTRGNVLPSAVAALGAGIHQNVLGQQTSLALQDQARKDALKQLILSAVTGQAGTAAAGYQRAYDVQAQQQAALNQGLGNLAYAIYNRPSPKMEWPKSTPPYNPGAGGGYLQYPGVEPNTPTYNSSWNTPVYIPGVTTGNNINGVYQLY